MTIYRLLLYVTLATSLVNCDTSSTSTETTDSAPNTVASVAGISDYYQDDFLVGAALGSRHILGKSPRGIAVVNREYNTITPENVMKWEEIHPAKDSFNWSASDAFVEYGESKEMFVVGHALVWHSQLSSYVKELTDAAEMEAAVKTHIDAVAGRYQGKINGWDVVNEALNEDGSLRESEFLKVMGPAYLPKAFAMAESAAPNAELYYNDYNMWKPEKRAGALRLVKAIQDAGVRIDGIGMQGHWGLEGPDLADVEASIIAYHEAGLQVMITELDVTVLPNPWDLEGAEVSQNFENSPEMNPYPQGLPDSIQTQLADHYEAIFQLFLKHRDKISRVTFWGVNDGHTWLNNWPINGRTNYPLLFDREYAPKAAYERIIKLKP